MKTGSRAGVGCALGVTAAGVAAALWSAGALTGIENFTWDQRVRALAEPADPRIKLILLDQPSLDWGEQVNGWSWPWPREVYVPLIEFCRRGGVGAIAFDVLFTEPSVYGVPDDDALGRAVARAPNFVAAMQPGDRIGGTRSWPEDVAPPPFEVEGLDDWLTTHPRHNISMPAALFGIPDIIASARVQGHVRGVIDRDNVVRRAHPVLVFDDQAVPMLGVAAWAATQISSSEDGGLHAPHVKIEGRLLHIGNRILPLDDRGRTILRYRRPFDRQTRHAFTAYSAAAVLQSELRLREGEPPTIDPEVFRDCYVLFGFNAPGLYDSRPTPFNKTAPGVSVHATILDNLLHEDAIAAAWPPLAGAFMLVAAITGGLWTVLSRSAVVVLTGFVLLLPIPILSGGAAYLMGYAWPIAAPESALLMALVGGVIVNYATEGRQRRYLKRAFQHYLSPDVIERVLEDPSRLELGGERRDLSIFFSDLAGFSSISEKLDPHVLTELLNDYLTDMTDIILDEGGTLDKYEGDAIIAFWNAPLDQPDHPLRAARALMRCQQKLAERSGEYEARTGAVLRMRTGINTGPVIVGNMGSNTRFDYTVLGDAANLAARLEGANKRFGTWGMVAESTWSGARALDTELVGRAIGSIRVVGRKTPVNVFEPLGFDGRVDRGAVRSFEHARLRVCERNWPAALEAFERLDPDPLVRTYCDKLHEVISNGGYGWDGVWNLTEK